MKTHHADEDTLKRLMQLEQENADLRRQLESLAEEHKNCADPNQQMAAIGKYRKEISDLRAAIDEAMEGASDE